MLSQLERDLRRQLLAYVRGQISLRAFDEWFVRATYNERDLVDASTRDLVGLVYLRLAEYSSGHWTEEQLREHLAQPVTSNEAELVPVGVGAERRQRAEELQ